MPDLRQRLDRLEASSAGLDNPIFVIAEPGEPHEDAITRHCAEHPDTPAAATFVVFVSGFSIAERDPIP